MRKCEIVAVFLHFFSTVRLQSKKYSPLDIMMVEVLGLNLSTQDQTQRDIYGSWRKTPVVVLLTLIIEQHIT